MRRKDIIAGAGLPLEEVTDILNSIAHMNDAKLWELNLPPDEDFIQKYPAVVKEQSGFWKMNENLFTAMDNRQNVKPQNVSSELQLPSPKKRTKSCSMKSLISMKSPRKKNIGSNISKGSKIVKQSKQISANIKR